MNDVLSSIYTSDPGRLIKSGDRIEIDRRQGHVQLVCMPGSEDADNYACTSTGGLLILFDDGILELQPFGISQRSTYLGTLSEL